MKLEPRRLALRIPFPSAPAGRYRVRIHGGKGDASAVLHVAIRRDGHRHATRRPERRGRGAAGRTELDLAFDWPGGPGEIVLGGTGDIWVDRIRLVPEWVPGLNRIAFPHEPALDVR